MGSSDLTFLTEANFQKKNFLTAFNKRYDWEKKIPTVNLIIQATQSHIGMSRFIITIPSGT